MSAAIEPLQDLRDVVLHGGVIDTEPTSESRQPIPPTLQLRPWARWTLALLVVVLLLVAAPWSSGPQRSRLQFSGPMDGHRIVDQIRSSTYFLAPTSLLEDDNVPSAKEPELKKFVLLFASLSLMVGLVGTEAASAAGPPAVSASHRAADLSKLNHSLAKLHKKKLTAKQASALGLHALSRDQVARLAKLQKSQAAKAADVGTYFWYQFQGSPGFLWVNRDYSGPYYSYPWYPYYVIYDNPYICTTGGGSCQQADTYFYSYYLYYYPNGTWYNYGPSGYTTGYQVGFGPYVYDIGV